MLPAFFLPCTLGTSGSSSKAATGATVIAGLDLLDPAATGTAILRGPHLHNFADIAKRLREAEAMRVVDDAAALAAALQELFADEQARERMAANAQQLLQAGRGALERTMALIEPALPK